VIPGETKKFIWGAAQGHGHVLGGTEGHVEGTGTGAGGDEHKLVDAQGSAVGGTRERCGWDVKATEGRTLKNTAMACKGRVHFHTVQAQNW